MPSQREAIRGAWLTISNELAHDSKQIIAARLSR